MKIHQKRWHGWKKDDVNQAEDAGAGGGAKSFTSVEWEEAGRYSIDEGVIWKGQEIAVIYHKKTPLYVQKMMILTQ